MAEYPEIRLGDKLIRKIAIGDISSAWDFKKPATQSAEVTAFLSATGITNPTYIDALNYLWSGLEAEGVTDKLYALYPFVGGNATAHSYNLINVAQYLISFSGTWVHDTNGITGNGINTYANTGFSPRDSVSGFAGNGSLAIYSRTNGSGDWYDFGSFTTGNQQTALGAKYSTGNAFFLSWPVDVQVANADSRGLFVGNSLAGTAPQGIWKNGAQIATNTTVAVNAVSRKALYIGANNGSTGLYSIAARNYSLAFIGQGLTSDQLTNMYAVVQGYQSILSRQV